MREMMRVSGRNGDAMTRGDDPNQWQGNLVFGVINVRMGREYGVLIMENGRAKWRSQ